MTIVVGIVLMAFHAGAGLASGIVGFATGNAMLLYQGIVGLTLFILLARAFL